jgi:hypothetical protein
MAKRQLVIVKSVNPAHDEDDAALPSMGDTSEVLEALAPFNTAPDGSAAGQATLAIGLIKLYGPGMHLEMVGGDDVRQVMVTMTDEDFAFPVLVRACQMNHWTMLDTVTGQRLRF